MAGPVIVPREMVIKAVRVPEVLTLMIGVDAAEEDQARVCLDDGHTNLRGDTQNRAGCCDIHRPALTELSSRRDGGGEGEQSHDTRENWLHRHLLITPCLCQSHTWMLGKITECFEEMNVQCTNQEGVPDPVHSTRAPRRLLFVPQIERASSASSASP
jgi:hypothetical protein